MVVKHENWFFCQQCNEVSYKFDCCMGTTCNGLGCDKCHDDNLAISDMIQKGEHPPIYRMRRSKSIDEILSG